MRARDWTSVSRYGRQDIQELWLKRHEEEKGNEIDRKTGPEQRQDKAEAC